MLHPNNDTVSIMSFAGEFQRHYFTARPSKGNVHEVATRVVYKLSECTHVGKH